MKLVSIAIITILVAFFLPAILLSFLKNIPSGFQPNLDSIAKVYKDLTISQQFTSPMDGLSGIGMSIRNFNLLNKKDVNLSIYQNNNLVRSSSVNGANIEDGSLIKFVFEPIKNSSNKQYSFTISSPDSTDQEALQVFYTTDTKMGQFDIKDNQTRGSISYITFHRTNSKLSLILNVYSKWLQRFFADPFFSILFILMILGISIYLIRHISILLLE